MSSDRLAKRICNLMVQRGFQAEMSEEHPGFFSIKSDLPNNDLMPHVFVRCHGSRIVVMGVVDLEAIFAKYACDAKDIAFALSAVVSSGTMDGVMVEIKAGSVVLQVMLRAGLLASVSDGAYNKVYDAKIEIYAVLSLIHDELQRLSQLPKP